MWTFLKYLFYLIILLALFYIGKSFYDSYAAPAVSETVVIGAE